MGSLGDILLAAAALGAGLFCLLLSRRLRALTTLESGMGKAIALLSAQVDDLSRSLQTARQTAEGTAGTLDAQTRRAETACRRLELLLASLHDLPVEPVAGRAARDVPGMRPPSPWPETAARRPEGQGERDGAGGRVLGDESDAETGRARLLRRPGTRPG